MEQWWFIAGVALGGASVMIASFLFGYLVGLSSRG